MINRMKHRAAPANLGRDECLEMSRLCLSASLRKTERIITRHYDSYLEPAGVTAVQLPILAIIEGAQDASFRMISERFELDRSTLSRNLGLMEEHGLLKIGPSSGPKPGVISLTAKGRKVLARGYARWTEAHRELERAITAAGVTDGLAFLKTLRRGARALPGPRAKRA